MFSHGVHADDGERRSFTAGAGNYPERREDDEEGVKNKNGRKSVEKKQLNIQINAKEGVLQ